MEDIRTEQPGVRIVPVRYYTPARINPPQVATPAITFTTGIDVNINLHIVSKTDGNPVADAKVIAFTNFAARSGAAGTTAKNGSVGLLLGSSKPTIERLYVFPKDSFWPLLRRNAALTEATQIEL
ncbi:MAG: hypothetical protein EOO39_41490, partial [Cytophagaceae bacterium]